MEMPGGGIGWDRYPRSGRRPLASQGGLRITRLRQGPEPPKSYVVDTQFGLRITTGMSASKVGWSRPSSCPSALTDGQDMVILMTMTTSMSLAEVKAHLSEVVSRVSGQHERVTVTVHGTPSAVLVAPEDLESLEETLAILSDPDTLRRMAASDSELAAGEGESEADLAAAMARRSRKLGA
jgi:antitoxin YefM